MLGYLGGFANARWHASANQSRKPPVLLLLLPPHFHSRASFLLSHARPCHSFVLASILKRLCRANSMHQISHLLTYQAESSQYSPQWALDHTQEERNGKIPLLSRGKLSDCL